MISIQRPPRYILPILIAEAIFGALICALVIADWIGSGPDGLATGILLGAVVLIVIGLLLSLPVLIWIAVREMRQKDIVQMELAAVTAGVILWLAISGWLIYLYLTLTRH